MTCLFDSFLFGAVFVLIPQIIKYTLGTKQKGLRGNNRHSIILNPFLIGPFSLGFCSGMWQCAAAALSPTLIINYLPLYLRVTIDRLD